MRRYLAAFHEAAQESLREPGSTFLPSPGVLWRALRRSTGRLMHNARQLALRNAATQGEPRVMRPNEPSPFKHLTRCGAVLVTTSGGLLVGRTGAD